MTATGPNGLIAAGLFLKLNVSSITSLATSGVYLDIAPQAKAPPFVIYQWQGGGDENDHPHRSRNTVWAIQALASTAGAADAIDAACDALLHNGSITITGYNVFWLRRENDVAYQEVDATGVVIYHSGGIYRIRNEHT